MTDTEMIRRCAEKMGWTVEPQIDGKRSRVRNADGDVIYTIGGIFATYRPLTEDAQCFALVKRFHLYIDPPDWQADPQGAAWQVTHYAGGAVTVIQSTDLNRAVVECVARIPCK